MSETPILAAQFEEHFATVDPDKPPRPELVGYSRVIRHLNRVESAVVRLHRSMVNSQAVRMPPEPVTAYERWQEQREDGELSSVFADIFDANPNAFTLN